MPKAATASRILIAIIAISVMLRVVVSFLLGNEIEILPSIADQLSYHNLALRILDGHGFSFEYDWWPATRAGEPTAHWSYLYTLYLAAVYAVFGPNPLVARLIQAIAGGVLMPWLAYRLARHVFPPNLEQPLSAPVPGEYLPRFTRLNGLNRLWAGAQPVIPLLAATWMAIYGYFIYFAAALMTETFYISGILWTLDCALRINQKNNLPRRLAWVELGAAIGVTALLRQVFLPFVPFLFLWLFWAGFRSARQDQRSAPAHKAPEMVPRSIFGATLRGELIAGLVIVLLIAPVTTFNYRQFERFVLLNTNAGYAFYWSNHPIYGDDYQPILSDDMPNYLDLLPKEVLWMDEAALDRELMRRGIQFVKDDPGRYLRLSLDRIPAYFIFWPLTTSSVFSNLTRVLSYGIALPFIIAGIVMWALDVRQGALSRRGKSRGWIVPARLEPGVLLLSFAVIYTLVHVLSWAGIRYRLPVDAVTLIFGARSLYGLAMVVLFKKPAEPTPE